MWGKCLDCCEEFIVHLINLKIFQETFVFSAYQIKQFII